MGVQNGAWCECRCSRLIVLDVTVTRVKCCNFVILLFFFSHFLGEKIHEN